MDYNSITPADKMALVGLFMVSEELEAQQQTALRSIAKILKMSFEVEAVKDGIDYGVFVCNGTVHERVDEMLRAFEIEVKEPVITPAGVNFYSIANLEKARNWLRNFGDTETLETHYLTNDLFRIPCFHSWLYLFSSVDALELYSREEMLQFHKDDIIEAALNGGLSFG